MAGPGAQRPRQDSGGDGAELHTQVLDAEAGRVETVARQLRISQNKLYTKLKRINWNAAPDALRFELALCYPSGV